LSLYVCFRPIADFPLAATLRAVKDFYPTAMSKWLGLAYAAGVILFLLWVTAAPDGVLFSFLFLPWIVGPAALAAMGANLSPSIGGAWAFFILEAVIIGSTIWVWFYLKVVAPDAQNGFGIVLFPVLQYAAVALFFLIAVLFGWRARPRRASSKRMT
jgi:hypothetical protein